MLDDTNTSESLDPRHSQYAWSFAMPSSLDLIAFTTALAQYNEDIGTELPVKDFVLLQSPVAIVHFEGVTPDSDGYEAMEVIVCAPHGPPLSFIPFLFRLHALIAPPSLPI